MNEINNTTAPVVMEQTSISTVNVDTAIEEWKAYQKITELMLDDTDYQNIKGNMYKKKSAWRKYARAFNITTEIIEKNISRNDKGVVTEADFTVRATLPTGRYADGWGNCSRREGNKSHPNHDIPATAMTRATNRAIADLIGAGEVTAEEIQAEVKFQAKQNAKAKVKKERVVVDAEILEPVTNNLDNAKEIAQSIVSELPSNHKSMLSAKLKLKELMDNHIVTDAECPKILKELESLL